MFTEIAFILQMSISASAFSQTVNGEDGVPQDQLGGMVIGTHLPPDLQMGENGVRYQDREIAGISGRLIVSPCGEIINKVSFRVAYSNTEIPATFLRWMSFSSDPKDSALVYFNRLAQALETAEWRKVKDIDRKELSKSPYRNTEFSEGTDPIAYMTFEKDEYRRTLKEFCLNDFKYVNKYNMYVFSTCIVDLSTLFYMKCTNGL